MSKDTRPGSIVDELRVNDSKSTQHHVLLRRIITPNAICEFGRRHDFPEIRSVQDFQQAVEIHHYDDLRPAIERMTHGEQDVLVSEPVRRFFITSGSAGVPKFIPVTTAFVREKWRAFQRYWGMVWQSYPDVSRGVMISNFSDGTCEKKTAGGASCSSESSFWNAWSAMNSGLERPLPSAVLNIADAGARYYTIARILLETDVSILMALNPSTILRLSETLKTHADRLQRDVKDGGLSPSINVELPVRKYISERYPGNPTRTVELRAAFSNGGPLAERLWPHLQLAVCWRSPMAKPYINLLNPFLAGLPQRDYVTMASEGIIAIPFMDSVNGGALAIDTHFYEFIPEHLAEESRPPTLLAHELQAGDNYVVVLTTSAGLYRYNIGDVVHVSGFIGSTPILEFLYRAGNTCSMTGEKLTEEQVVTAVTSAASRSCLDLHAFTLCPVTQPFPRYALLSELHSPSDRDSLKRFLAEMDCALGCSNVEYLSKRTSHRLGAPEMWILRPGSYAALRQRRVAGGVSDSQVKVACLTRDPTLSQQFEVLEQISCESVV